MNQRSREQVKRVAVVIAGIAALLMLRSPFAETDLPVERVLESGQAERIDLMLMAAASGRLVLVQKNMATILAVSDGRPTGTLSLSSQPTALAFDAHSDKALIALGHENLLVIADLEAIQSKAELASAVDFPSLAAFDRASGGFIVASRHNPGLGMVSTAGNLEIAASTEEPLAALSTSGRGWLFAAAAGSPVIYVFDSLSLKDLGIMPAPGCETPSDMALDDMERRLYLSCTNGLFLVLDSDTGVVLSRQHLPAAGTSRLALRTLRERTVQAILLAEGGYLAVIEGRIMATGIRSVYRSPVDAHGLQAEQGGGRVFLASGSGISVLDLK